jgi:hypothetical protein
MVILSGSRRPSLASRPLRTARASFPACRSSLGHSLAAVRMQLVMAVLVQCHQIIHRVCSAHSAWDPVMQVYGIFCLELAATVSTPVALCSD